MFPSKKAANLSSSSHERPPPLCVQGNSGLVLATDPKPRLRWTAELHDRFVDAVRQLGGPDSRLTALLPLLCYMNKHHYKHNWFVCRGDAENHHESYGRQGPHSLSPQEPSPSTIITSSLCYASLVYHLEKFNFGMFCCRNLDSESNLTRILIMIIIFSTVVSWLISIWFFFPSFFFFVCIIKSWFDCVDPSLELPRKNLNE